MAGFASSKPGGPITGINVTPLVDIVLVLLIIFMVTAKLVVSRGIPTDLPRAATGTGIDYVLAVSLLADGTSSIDGSPLPEGEAGDGELLGRARAALAQHPDLRAVVQADGIVPHARVMHALDVLRQAGISKIAFAVQAGPPVDATESAPAEATR